MCVCVYKYAYMYTRGSIFNFLRFAVIAAVADVGRRGSRNDCSFSTPPPPHGFSVDYNIVLRRNNIRLHTHYTPVAVEGACVCDVRVCVWARKRIYARCTYRHDTTQNRRR